MKELLLCFCFLLAGCDDLIVKDISREGVVLFAPADSVKTIHASQTFVWEGMEGATGYRLVVVGPDFGRVELYLLDTLVCGGRFAYTLPPGRYEWGVRAENSGYVTGFSWRMLEVVHLPDEDGTDEK